jgi:hypothetical protein
MTLKPRENGRPSLQTSPEPAALPEPYDFPYRDDDDDGRPLVLSEGQRLLLCAPESLTQVAAAVGVSKQVVSRWRQGRKVPNVQHRLRLQTALGISAEEWVHEPSGPAPPPVERPKPAAGSFAASMAYGPRPGSSSSKVAPSTAGSSSSSSKAVAPSSASSSSSSTASKGSSSSKVAPAATVEPPPARAPASPPKAAGDAGQPTTMEGVETLLRTIRQHRAKPGLLAAESVKLADAETRLLSLKHRLEREAFDEARVVQLHPTWHRIKQVIATTLVKWPDAARAVAVALKEIDK